MLITKIRKMTHVIMWGFLGIFVISCFFMYGYNKPNSQQQAQQQQDKSSKYVLSVDGVEIDRVTFNNRYQQFKRQYEQLGGANFDSYPARMYLEAVVAQFVGNQELLLQEAKKRGVRADFAEVNKRMHDEMNATLGPQEQGGNPSLGGRIKSFFGGRERRDKFNEVLYRRGLTFDSYKKMVERDVLQEAITKAIAKDRLAEEKKNALKKSNDVLGKLHAGETFELVAAQFSDDEATKFKGGELGWINRGMIAKEVEDVAFKIAPNQYSSPIETKLGYHIIQVIEKKMAEGPEFEAQKADIAESIRQERGPNNKTPITADDIKNKYERVHVRQILTKIPSDQEIAQEWIKAERAKGKHKIVILDKELDAYMYMNNQMTDPTAKAPDLDKGLEKYNAAAKQDPQNQNIQYQIGLIYERKNTMLNMKTSDPKSMDEPEEADPYAEAMAESSSESATGTKAAAKPAKKAEKKDAKSTKFLKEAHEAFQNAVRLSDNAKTYDSAILMSAAKLAEKLGYEDIAVKDYRMVVEFTPSDKKSLIEIRDAMKKSGRKDAKVVVKLANERIKEFEEIEKEQAAQKAEEEKLAAEAEAKAAPEEKPAEATGTVQPPQPQAVEVKVDGKATPIKVNVVDGKAPAQKTAPAPAPAAKTPATKAAPVSKTPAPKATAAPKAPAPDPASAGTTTKP